jgi:hypothetical protein
VNAAGAAVLYFAAGANAGVALCASTCGYRKWPATSIIACLACLVLASWLSFR